MGVDEIVPLRGRACLRERRWARQAESWPPFRAEVTGAACPIPTGMVLDLGLLERSMAEVRKMLDHKLLNNVDALGPPTLENLSRFIWERVERAGRITRVSVHRDSCNESCTYFGRQG